jgi:hypothetical protein
MMDISIPLENMPAVPGIQNMAIHTLDTIIAEIDVYTLIARRLKDDRNLADRVSDSSNR